ncbi:MULTISPECIES: ABC transporter ATP-binding protein [Ruminococcus]|uniref:Energy-coupling factor ABC transporter ATP-binding protein n=1 Tax=Ruminococcus bovis TaxID=2564099 RepID=A0A4P8XUZ2_9FIRM|nr:MULTISPECIES: ABC transporter ATP-binding protein [Ruminococcus]MEE3439201.1 energy-coupling factor transporter ATPase [Ruminococcus sp.]QCT06204.1 energy-coupling factor ABC transporter ATP-binding protein [Ruminococcus bovis]
MEILSIKDLTFSYPNKENFALQNVNLSINSGDFVVVCGQSGSGKTTLLRMLKKEIAPHGEKQGAVFYKGEDVEKLDDKISAQKIGFVFQKPDQQIVTDKVWHELAFGLESLGYDSDYIRLRVGEMANYFGITSLFRKKTTELSGGQKQLMNLASVMAMSPDVIILDEPTSQLDPITANDFITTLKKINDELGLTVIIIEHRLQEVFPIADKVAVMEDGKVICYDTPRNVCEKLSNHPMSQGFPSAVRIWQKSGGKGECPLTVKEGRNFINLNFSERKLPLRNTIPNTEDIITLKDVFFRYEKGGNDILSGTNLSIKKGEHFCILGGNGSGKTTTLKILAGLLKPYRGKVIIDNNKMTKKTTADFNRLGVAMLPQNPESVFLKSRVIDDYTELCKIKGIEKSAYEEKINSVAEKLGIKDLLENHPYDLSGGEIQKCALGKVLISEPKILLLDEPTKGVDAYSKLSLSKILQEIRSDGVTIITVTHDVEFASIVADRCGLFFDGEVLSSLVPQEFFSKNNFYTTASSRISRDKFANAVTVDDVVSLIKEEQNG